MLWRYLFIIAGVLIAIEIFTGMFYLLILALGFLVGGFISFLRSVEKTKKDIALTDPNIHIDIGNALMIENWKMDEMPIKACVSYRSTMWDAELKRGAKA